MALRVFSVKGNLQSDGGRTPVVRNIHMKVLPSSGIPSQGASNSRKPMEEASISGTPPQGASNSSKAVEGGT
jgi:hypothetical protein